MRTSHFCYYALLVFSRPYLLPKSWILRLLTRSFHLKTDATQLNFMCKDVQHLETCSHSIFQWSTSQNQKKIHQKKLRVSSVPSEVTNLIPLTHRYRPTRRIFSAKSLIPILKVTLLFVMSGDDG